MIALLLKPFLACIGLTAILGYLGIHVLLREIIFVDIALAQTAAVGTIAAHLACGAHTDSPLALFISLSFVLASAAFYALVRNRTSQLPLEAVIGVTYALAAAATLFLLGIAPGGHTHLQNILSGSLLWVTWQDILVGSLVFGVVGVLLRIFRRPFNALSTDYVRAQKQGLSVIGWDFLFYSLCGIVITLAVHLAGVVVVFSFLIIPASLSALFSAHRRTRLLLTWTAGITASVFGLLWAYYLDFSVGPSIAMMLGLELLFSSIAARFKSVPVLSQEID